MKKAFALVIFLASVLPTTLLAHGTGASIERAADGYLIDIGYQPEEIEAGAQVRFDFVLARENGKATVFDRVFVRIEGENGILFAGGIAKATLGGTGLSIRFPEAGQYTLFARFEQGGELLVETEAPLTVAEGKQRGTAGSMLYVFSGAALVIGLGIGLLLGRRRKLTPIRFIRHS